VAFISGVPLTIRLRNNEFRASEVNFLCIHKKLRSKRLTPILIKEVTRQCHLQGVFQAIYTSGAFLPTPVSICRYHHRALNVPKLVDVGFTFVPRNMTLARMIKLNKVATVPVLSQGGGLREMVDADVPAVTDLYKRYMTRFHMVPDMNEDDIRHQLLSGKGVGERDGQGWKGRRKGQVVWTYVVENPETKRITDFFSFYSLPSTIINNVKYGVLEAAYLFYYATEAGIEPQGETSGRLRKRLQELINDALVIAHEANFDVFNSMTLMDNLQFIEDLKFGAGDGLLNFYLYNWRTSPLAGVKPVEGVGAGKGVGVVML
jgi:glycylpeptide N-tetradecanoyltransferase